jgi:hypothetical protein
MQVIAAQTTGNGPMTRLAAATRSLIVAREVPHPPAAFEVRIRRKES